MAAGYPGQPLALLLSAGFGVMAVIAALAVWRGHAALPAGDGVAVPGR